MEGENREITRDDVWRAALEWEGTPYRKKGRGRGGIDCVGLTVQVGRTIGLTLNDRNDYNNWPSTNHEILRELEKYLRIISPTSDNWHGLIGAFAASATLPGHVGIFGMRELPWEAPRLHLCHAHITHGVTVEPWGQIDRQRLRLVRLYAPPMMRL